MHFTDLANGQIEKLVCTESTRYGITNVWFDAERGRLVATNGHCLGITHVKTEEGETSGFIPPAALAYYRTLLKSKPDFGLPIVTFKVTKDDVIVEELKDRITRKFKRPTGAGSFANYEAVLPVLEGPPALCFSLSLLNKLVEGLGRPSTGTNSTSDMVAIWTDDRNKAFLVKTSEKGALGILMPMSSNETGWLTTLESIEGKLYSSAVATPPEDEDDEEDEEVQADSVMKEDDEGAEHITFSRADWRTEVNNDDTKLGYWDWVHHKEEAEVLSPAAA